MTIIYCGNCKKELVQFNDTFVKEHRIEENWIIANCTKCDKTTGIDGVTC